MKTLRLPSIGLPFVTACLGILLAACSTSPRQLNAPTPEDTFAGFRPLSSPRKKIPIGAAWIKGVGPIENDGLAEADRNVSGSLSSLYLKQHSELSGGISLTLRSILGLDLNGSANSIYELNTGPIDIVTVKDYAKLGPLSGQYLWEGLRLSSFTVTDTSGKATTLRAQIVEALQKVTGGPRGFVTADSSNTVTATGQDLFVGFRIMEFKLQPSQIVSKIILNSPESRPFFEAGKDREYTLHFAVADSTSSAVSVSPNKSGCAAVMRIDLPHNARAGGVPNVKQWGMSCAKGQDSDIYSLEAYRTGEKLLILDDLLIEPTPRFSVDFDLHSAAVNGVSGMFEVRQKAYEMTPDPHPSAQGWTKD
ncbi:MAG: hypothetical protein HY077_14175 [Elusimicrobia bacterium]|nr:hypothetical protein [Elusimicrobiota bacterium]